MKSYINVSTSKRVYIISIALLSILHFKQVFAHLENENFIFKKDHITVILTKLHLFEQDSSSGFNLSDKFTRLVTSQEKDNNKSLKIIVTPCSGNSNVKLKGISDDRVKAMNSLAFSCKSPDLGNKRGWDRYPKDSELKNYKSTLHNYCFIKKAEENSQLSQKFKNTNMYIAYSNTLYDLKLTDIWEFWEEEHEEFKNIERLDKAYAGIKQGLIDILKKNDDTSECHIILPLLERYYDLMEFDHIPEHVTSGLYNNFIHCIYSEQELPTTIYINLYNVNDQKIKQIDNHLTDKNFLKTIQPSNTLSSKL